MATHCSILAWRIPWTQEPGGLQSIGSHRVRHDRIDLALLYTRIKFVSFSPVNLSWVNFIISLATRTQVGCGEFPPLCHVQIGKLRPNKPKQFAQGHLAP